MDSFFVGYDISPQAGSVCYLVINPALLPANRSALQHISRSPCTLPTLHFCAHLHTVYFSASRYKNTNTKGCEATLSFYSWIHYKEIVLKELKKKKAKKFQTQGGHMSSKETWTLMNKFKHFKSKRKRQLCAGDCKPDPATLVRIKNNQKSLLWKRNKMQLTLWPMRKAHIVTWNPWSGQEVYREGTAAQRGLCGQLGRAQHYMLHSHCQSSWERASLEQYRLHIN